MADGTPVTYEDLTEELKKKYDEVKAILEADPSALSQNPLTWRRGKGSPRRRADGGGPVSPRRKNAPGNHEASILSVRQLSGLTKERCHSNSRPPLPFALAAPEPSSPAYVVHKTVVTLADSRRSA
ncbi:hypothetical protein QYE76_067724 [Lolium multiflorum]|uniref:Uncharacterized protein n=1 Tax=Lolium multiflorum TaxID=4521 RepID=A0AAD8SDD0_LOLMU|nr:hypothetical protein QYE76_067724 [Lolium multiflorum]